MKFLAGICLLTLGQIIAFVQMQGQFKYSWMKNNAFLMSCIGIPLSYILILSTNLIVQSFDGNAWPSRLIGFAIGAIVFTIMSKWWFDEPFTFKTGVCLVLAFCILGIQLYGK